MKLRNKEIRIRPGKAQMDFVLRLTSKDVEDQLSRMVYNQWEAKDAATYTASNRMKIPPINMAFYQLLILTNRIPSFEMLLAFYKKCLGNPGYFDGSNRSARDLDEALYAERIHRAYPSLVRDFHFMLKLNEAGLNARYSMEGDLNGVDVYVEEGGLTFAVAIYRGSSKSKEFRKEKNKDIDNLIEVVSEVNTKTNAITLLGDEHVDAVKDMISKRLMFAEF